MIFEKSGFKRKRLHSEEDFIKNYYFFGNLNANRIDKNSIDRAEQIFRMKFPKEKLIVITDSKELFGKNSVSYLDVNPDDFKYAVVAFESDEKAYNFLQKNKNLIYISAQKFYPTSRYFHKNDKAKEILLIQSQLQKEKFEVADYENIIQVIENVKDIDGDYIEIGVYKGGSSYTALKYMKEKEIPKKVYLIDLFDGFKYKEAQSSVDRFWANLLDDIDIDSVNNFLNEFNNYEIVKANIITDSLPPQIEKVSACNIDVDMYEAIVAALKKISELVVIGGIIILEDVGHTPALIGAHVAYKEFKESEMGRNFHSILLSSGQALLIRYK